MDLNRAQEILAKMAKSKYNSTNIDKVLEEFLKYEKNGECQHFWPDENTACKLMLNYNNSETGV
jgi:hypothetical protein